MAWGLGCEVYVLDVDFSGLGFWSRILELRVGPLLVGVFVRGLEC